MHMTFNRNYQLAVLLIVLPVITLAAPAVTGVDAACLEEMNKVQACGNGSQPALKQCMQKRLSPGCIKLTEAGNGKGTEDPSCKNELQQAAQPCVNEMYTVMAQCAKKVLSPRCIAQYDEAGKTLQNRMNTCQDVMHKRFNVCKAEAGSADKIEGSCLDRFKPEVDSACQGDP